MHVAPRSPTEILSLISFSVASPFFDKSPPLPLIPPSAPVPDPYGRNECSPARTTVGGPTPSQTPECPSYTKLPSSRTLPAIPSAAPEYTESLSPPPYPSQPQP